MQLKKIFLVSEKKRTFKTVDIEDWKKKSVFSKLSTSKTEK